MIRRIASLACLALTAALPSQDGKPSPVDFEKQVWPILEKRCVECHATAHTGPDGKTKKPKGGVVLDSKDGITTSKRGKLVVAKKSASSLIYETISLPADDEDRMPPAKKGDPLSQEQIALIQRWIDEGAEFGKWTGKQKDKQQDKDGGSGAGPGKGGKPVPQPGDQQSSMADIVKALQQGVEPLPATILAALDGSPFTVRSIGDDSPLLRVTCSGRGDEVDDAALAALDPIAGHVIDLDLGRSRIGDEGCQRIARMPRLVVLDLRQTQVGNHGVAALAACRELRSLNLFGTKAGDYGAAALASLRHLEHVYVWQTEVSAAAVVRLREAVPGVRVVLAADLPEPMADAPASARRRNR
jgi:hypothetical protein